MPVITAWWAGWTENFNNETGPKRNVKERTYASESKEAGETHSSTPDLGSSTHPYEVRPFQLLAVFCGLVHFFQLVHLDHPYNSSTPLNIDARC